MEPVDERLGLLTRRTYGMETEYSIMSALGNDLGTRFLLGLKSGGIEQQYLSNGGRLYWDLSHPEYATPECVDPWEVTRFHHAGDTLLHDLQLKAAEGGNFIQLRRDNIDWTDRKTGEFSSYGCHENYLTLKSVSSTIVRDQLIPYLVSSPLLFGSGYSQPDGSYLYSMRASVVTEVEAVSAAAGNRAIINTRDEAHLPAELEKMFARLHVTCRDANVSEQATFLKTASMSIVLAMIETGTSFEDLMPDYPVEGMKELNADIWGKAEISTASGSMSALMIQREIFSRVGTYLWNIKRDSGWESVPGWVFEAYGLWSQALDDLTEFTPDDWPQSSYWIDWWVKRHLLKEYEKQYARYGDTTPEHFFMVSRQYHDIDPDESLAVQLLEDQLLLRRFSDYQLRMAAYNPSTHFRAQERAQWVEKSSSSPSITNMSWKGCSEGITPVIFAFAI